MSIDTITKTPNQTIDWAATAARLAADLEAEAKRCDETDSFVEAGYGRLRQAGFFKAFVPADLGGGGAELREMCDAIRRLAVGCGSTALAFSMHSHLVATAAWRREHQQAPTEGLLKRVVAEELVLVSSGGSDWLNSAGAATRTDGGFLINARKVFSSSSPMGDLLMTSAVYDDPAAGPTVLHFGVPMKAKGVAILDTWRVMGMRGTGSHDIELKDVFVADAAIAGRRPQGKWHMLFHVISMIAFPLIYSAYVGVAEGARAKALAAARKRGEDESLSFMVGEMDNALAGARLALADMIANAEAGDPGFASTNRVMTGRTLAGQGAIRTVERAMEVAGGSAFFRSSGLERAFRDVQGARYHPLQEKAQLRYAGRLALGLDLDG